MGALLGSVAARTCLVVLGLAAIGIAFLWVLFRVLPVVRLWLAAHVEAQRAYVPPSEDRLYVLIEQGTYGIACSVTPHWRAGAIGVADWDQAKAVIDHRVARYLCSERFPSPHRFRLLVSKSLLSPRDVAFIWLETPELLQYQVVHCDCHTAPPVPVRSVQPSEGYSPDEIRTLLLRAFPAQQVHAHAV